MKNNRKRWRMDSDSIPSSLRTWFIIHCIIDLLFAIPLFFFPEATLSLIGWPYYDPLTTRLVAAALFGIGLESYFGSKAPKSHYLGMLRLKRIWSAAATLGILLTMFTLSIKPLIGWVLALLFAVFHFIWWFYQRKLKE